MVNDEGEAFDIDAAGGDVGGDKELGALFFEGPHDFVALPLGKVALKHSHRVAPVGELLGKHIGAVFGASEDEAAFVALAVEKGIDKVGFVFLDANREAVVDVSIDDIFVIDLHRLGIGRHAEFDEVVQNRGEGGGE